MSATGITLNSTEKRLYRFALALAVFTIAYNFIEGLISSWLGFRDESLALFGFGIDSFIEVVSGIGIAQMVVRVMRNPHSSRSPFERTALKVTGFSFYALTAGLLVTGGYNLITGHQPETAFWGVVISLISLAVMWALVYGKMTTGKKLRSDAIIADAKCTLVCIYMSVILLVSSGIYELTGFGMLDALGSFALAWFSFREGRECFEKARSEKLCGCEEEEN